MNLAPLADVVAYLDSNPSRLVGVKQALKGRFDTVWSPIQGCVMATRALPHSVPDDEDLRVAGVAFAEGRDTVARRSVAGLELELLPGNVGFVRAERDKLVVVRSGPGVVPWYVWQDPERALVSTSFTQLVRLLPVPPELDPLVCAAWGSFIATFPDGRSFVRGVTVIPAGHAADVRPGQTVRSRVWWNPWPEELPWPSRATRADHVERFREAVLTGLAREVAEEPVNLLTLSGGVDSSVLAHLVSRHLGRPLAAVSFLNPGEGPGARLDASYLDPLVAELSIAPHLRYPVGTADWLALAAGAPPVAFPVIHPALQVLGELVGEWGVEVLVGGEFADEICGGSFALADWLDAVSLPRLVSQLTALPRGRRDVRAWAGRRRSGRQHCPGPWPAALEDWARPEVDAEYQAWRADQLRALRASSAPHRYQRAVLTWLEGALAMNWEVCSSLRVRRAFPFLSAEVLQVVAGCHPVELLGPGVKRLERQAFAGLVPERYLHRPDKGGRWDGDGDDLLVDAPITPESLSPMMRDDVAPMTPSHAAGVAALGRLAERVADLLQDQNGAGP